MTRRKKQAAIFRNRHRQSGPKILRMQNNAQKIRQKNPTFYFKSVYEHFKIWLFRHLVFSSDIYILRHFSNLHLIVTSPPSLFN